MSYTMKAEASGFDGVQSYGPGDVIEVDRDHARRALLRGAATLLGDDGRKVPLVKAIAALALPDDDVLAIETSDKAVLAMQDRINSQRKD